MGSSRELLFLFAEYLDEIGRNPKLEEFFSLLMFTINNQLSEKNVYTINVLMKNGDCVVCAAGFGKNSELYDLNDNIYTLFNDLVSDLGEELSEDSTDLEYIRQVTSVIFENLVKTDDIEFSDISKREIKKIEVVANNG